MRKLLVVLLLMLSMSFAAEAQQEIKAGMYILNIGKFDTSTGSYTVDMYLSFRCADNCSEKFEFMNGRATTIEKIYDNGTDKYWRIQAQLSSDIDLRKYPFDAQSLNVIIEDKVNAIDSLIYVPDEELTGLDEAAFVAGWEIANWSIYSDVHEYEVYGEQYSRLQISVGIQRVFLNSFIRNFLPVIFIIIVVVISYIMDLDKILNRITLQAGALTAAVMFHVAILSQIPPLGYMTFADKFMILTYFFLVLSVMLSIFMLELKERKMEDHAEKFHRRTEFLMPIIIILSYILLFSLFI